MTQPSESASALTSVSAAASPATGRASVRKPHLGGEGIVANRSCSPRARLRHSLASLRRSLRRRRSRRPPPPLSSRRLPPSRATVSGSCASVPPAATWISDCRSCALKFEIHSRHRLVSSRPAPPRHRLLDLRSRFLALSSSKSTHPSSRRPSVVRGIRRPTSDRIFAFKFEIGPLPWSLAAPLARSSKPPRVVLSNSPERDLLSAVQPRKLHRRLPVRRPRARPLALKTSAPGLRVQDHGAPPPRIARPFIVVPHVCSQGLRGLRPS